MILQDTQITFRVSKDTKEKFDEIVKMNKLSSAFVLRKLMLQYINTKGKDVKLDE